METTDKDSGGIGCLGIVGIVVVTILVTIAVTVWAINSQLFGSRFTPVELNESEQSALASKLSAVGLGELAAPADEDCVVLRGVSVWGVPIPNAWLGNVKNVDLVNEFGAEEGFWKQFSEGVENVEIREGELFLKLRE